jgi:hypothetical protein
MTQLTNVENADAKFYPGILFITAEVYGFSLKVVILIQCHRVTGSPAFSLIGGVVLIFHIGTRVLLDI